MYNKSMEIALNEFSYEQQLLGVFLESENRCGFHVTTEE